MLTSYPSEYDPGDEDCQDYDAQIKAETYPLKAWFNDYNNITSWRRSLNTRSEP